MFVGQSFFLTSYSTPSVKGHRNINVVLIPSDLVVKYGKKE